MRRQLILVVALLALASACDRSPSLVRLAGGSMGTSWSVQLVARDDLDTAALVQATLDEVENSMSTWIDDSEISRFNRAAAGDWFPVSAAFCEVVELALEVSSATNGALDVTVGPLVDAWGFGAGSGEPAVPDPALLDELRATTGYDKLEADCSQPALRKSLDALQIDLSAVAKGYGVDRVADALDRAGFTNYLVEVGGEMRIRGTKPGDQPWRVGVEAPDRDARRIFDALTIANTGLASSGDYRNYFEAEGRYFSHTLDPRSGAPVDHGTAAVTVLLPRSARADAWATALLVMGRDDGLALAERENIAALFLTRTENGTESTVSSRFAGLTGYVERSGDTE